MSCYIPISSSYRLREQYKVSFIKKAKNTAMVYHWENLRKMSCRYEGSNPRPPMTEWWSLALTELCESKTVPWPAQLTTYA